MADFLFDSAKMRFRQDRDMLMAAHDSMEKLGDAAASTGAAIETFSKKALDTSAFKVALVPEVVEYDIFAFDRLHKAGELTAALTLDTGRFLVADQLWVDTNDGELGARFPARFDALATEITFATKYGRPLFNDAAADEVMAGTSLWIRLFLPPPYQPPIDAQPLRNVEHRVDGSGVVLDADDVTFPAVGEGPMAIVVCLPDGSKIKVGEIDGTTVGGSALTLSWGDSGICRVA